MQHIKTFESFDQDEYNPNIEEEFQEKEPEEEFQEKEPEEEFQEYPEEIQSNNDDDEVAIIPDWNVY